MSYFEIQTVTRPNNTTAYTAGDVVGGAFRVGALPESVNGQRDFLLTHLALLYPASSIPSGMTSFRMHFYNRTPPSAIADNAAFDLAAADRPYYLGYEDVGTLAVVGSSLFVKVSDLRTTLRAGDTGVWAYLVTNGGFTPPAVSEQLLITCGAVDV